MPAWRRSSLFTSLHGTNVLKHDIERLDYSAGRSSNSHQLLQPPATCLLYCPHKACSKIRECASIKLFDKGKWGSLKCPHCLHSCTSRKWLCSCGIPWFGCALHSCTGFACRPLTHRARALPSTCTPGKAAWSNSSAPPQTLVVQNQGEGPVTRHTKRRRLSGKSCLARSVSSSRKRLNESNEQAIASIKRLRMSQFVPHAHDTARPPGHLSSVVE